MAPGAQVGAAALLLALLLATAAPTAHAQHIREAGADAALNPMYKEADLGNGHTSTVKGDTVFATFMPSRRPPPNPLPCLCTDVDPHPTFITRPNYTCWWVKALPQFVPGTGLCVMPGTALCFMPGRKARGRHRHPNPLACSPSNQPFLGPAQQRAALISLLLLLLRHAQGPVLFWQVQ